MSVKSVAKNTVMFPLWAAAVLTSTKSFRSNPVLASPRLNRMGLHVKRIELAAKLTDRPPSSGPVGMLVH